MAVKERSNSILGDSQNLVQLVLMLLLIVAAFFIGMLWTKVQNLETGGSAPRVANNAGNDVPSAPSGPLGTADDVAPVSDADWVKGNRNAKIALIEYSDYECPYCKSFHATAQQAVDEYGDDLVWVYRHFPLESIHPNARARAIGAECAGKLGGNDAFWKYTDGIFSASGTIDIEKIAADAGLNASQFASCLDAEETADLVDEDVNTATTAGITGTPGNILLNTETGKTAVLPGAVPFSMLKSAVDDLLAE